jgi:hypothetical protein
MASAAYDDAFDEPIWAAARPRSERLLRPRRPSYPRLLASVICRPAGLRAFARPDDVRTLAPRGVRIFSDEAFDVGDRWKLEMITAGGGGRSFVAEVAWVDPLPANPDARYDVGLTIEAIDPETSALLNRALADDESASITPR